MSDVYQIDGTKVGLHPQRLAQWMDAGDDLDALMKVAPLYVEISPVGQCNHRCTFCSVDYIGYQSRQLKREALQGALESLGAMGVKSVMFAGEGEPLPDRGGAVRRTVCERATAGVDSGMKEFVETPAPVIPPREIRKVQ